MDQEIFELISKEQDRQQLQLRMIPSENYVSNNVMNAVGSVLMNKYSEGQAFKRYYQGNQYIDQIETLVKEKALSAFKLDSDLWGVNVQAVTGSVANLAVYNALLQPGAKLFSMFLYDGGHLSHGWQLADQKNPGKMKKVSFTSKIFEPSYYYVDPNERVFNYDEVRQRAIKEQPDLIISGGTAYPREINHQRMRKIADEVGAIYHADIAHEAGLVLAGVNSSPFEHAHVVTMTTRKTLRGPIGSIIFGRQEYMKNINSSVFPGLQGGPQNHSIAGIGIALHEATQPEFTEYAEWVVKNAQTLAAKLIENGFDVTSGGTDKHLVLIDLRNKDLAGTALAVALEKANIIVNKNTVPGDTAKPWNPSGIRLGTPALTTRGMKTGEMKHIADWITQVSENIDSDDSLIKIGEKVETLTSKFPAPGISQ